MKASINTEQLVVQSVIGEIHSPTLASPYRVGQDGTPVVFPGTGGITYNVKVGDPAFGMRCDHVEPGVSIRNSDSHENGALNTLACVGNIAKVVSGEAKGATGIVTGKHGGVEHLLIYFDAETLEKLAIGDKIQVRAVGQGMQLKGFEDSVKAMNLDPELFARLGVQQKKDKLSLPVAAVVPAYLMGSGMGATSAYRGDYDIMTGDAEELAAHGLDKLRYGDIVLLKDCDTSYGRGYLKGAVTVGVVVHSNCILAGHGPGVTTLFTAKQPIIEGVLKKNANIADYLGI